MKNLIIDLIATFLFFILLFLIGVDYTMFILLVVVFPFLIITKRKDLIFSLIVALMIAVIWGWIAEKYYVYAESSFKTELLNFYPILFWTIGLFMAILLFRDIKLIFGIKTFKVKLIIFSGLFWFGLLSIETISYHILEIRNLATAECKGLPICNCIHAPLWMQISYFIIGPLYFIILNILSKGMNKTKIKLYGIKLRSYIKNK